MMHPASQGMCAAARSINMCCRPPTFWQAIHSLEGKPMLRELSPTFRIR